MTVPSIEELQRLLDEATPGPWVASKSGYIGSVTAGTMIHDGQVLGDTAEDTSLIALAPVLAAEVIRLREENEELTKLRFDHH